MRLYSIQAAVENNLFPDNYKPVQMRKLANLFYSVKNYKFCAVFIFCFEAGYITDTGGTFFQIPPFGSDRWTKDFRPKEFKTADCVLIKHVFRWVGLG